MFLPRVWLFGMAFIIPLDKNKRREKKGKDKKEKNRKIKWQIREKIMASNTTIISQGSPIRYPVLAVIPRQVVPRELSKLLWYGRKTRRTISLPSMAKHQI